MAKKAFLTVGKVYRKIKKQYITDNGVYRRVKKIYETVDGVYVLRWTGGDTWHKYTCSREWRIGYYLRDDFSVGYTYISGDYYGKPVSLQLYDGYIFDRYEGFSGTTKSSYGKYMVYAGAVYIADEITVNQNYTTDFNIYLDILWRCVASATHYQGDYTYTIGEYVGEVTTDEGELPTIETPELYDDDEIYVIENGNLYYYKKVLSDDGTVENTLISSDGYTLTDSDGLYLTYEEE